jgi:hypothetical protein
VQAKQAQSKEGSDPVIIREGRSFRPVERRRLDKGDSSGYRKKEKPRQVL